ncbi:unnamed protein product [Ambrosiozyma monospora]|uniref:Unnamed protein product n=1 Tax=Ambrosiozyma monospora TaxID=43982 RepID=A0ACB5TKZ8_AMBMO|nr:unnamed protein product [Ambrosiozyma monospora]
MVKLLKVSEVDSLAFVVNGEQHLSETDNLKFWFRCSIREDCQNLQFNTDPNEQLMLPKACYELRDIFGIQK